jgi:hypothetical protein
MKHAKRVFGIIAVFGLSLVLAHVISLGTSRSDGVSAGRVPDGKSAPPLAPDEGNITLAEEKTLAAGLPAGNSSNRSLGEFFGSGDLQPPPLPF